MRITVESEITTAEELDIEFPLYLNSNDSMKSADWTTLHRIEEDGTHYTITKEESSFPNREVTYEFSKCTLNFRVELGRSLKHYSSATESDFMEFLTELREELAKFPTSTTS